MISNRNPLRKSDHYTVEKNAVCESVESWVSWWIFNHITKSGRIGNLYSQNRRGALLASQEQSTQEKLWGETCRVPSCFISGTTVCYKSLTSMNIFSLCTIITFPGQPLLRDFYDAPTPNHSLRLPSIGGIPRGEHLGAQLHCVVLAGVLWTFSLYRIRFISAVHTGLHTFSTLLIEVRHTVKGQHAVYLDRKDKVSSVVYSAYSI